MPGCEKHDYCTHNNIKMFLRSHLNEDETTRGTVVGDIWRKIMKRKSLPTGVEGRKKRDRKGGS